MTENGSGFLTGDQFLSTSDLEYGEVETHDGKLRVRGMDGVERADFLGYLAQKGATRETMGQGGFLAESIYLQYAPRAIFLCAVDAHGNRLFSDEKLIEQLGRRSPRVLLNAMLKIMSLSNLTADALENAEKNSETAPSSSSSSISAES